MPNYRYSESPGSHGRYYEYDAPGGRRVVAEHTSDPNNPGPHFHAGRLNDADEDFFHDRYVPVDGDHHFFYPE